MKYAETGSGNYADDASLEGIEDAQEGEGFGIPGQSAVGTVGSFRFADISNEDENSTELVGPKRVTSLDVTSEPGTIENEGLSSVSPGSLSPIIGGNKMSKEARIAYIMENGQPKCASCEEYYVPNSIKHAKLAHCGKPSCPDLSNVEGPNAKDLDAGADIVKQDAKTASKLDTTDDFLDLFSKVANDSDLYYHGYTDAENGKPLDEDLALLSKDYYNGYEQRKFYNKAPQQSEGQKLFDIKPNSNEIPRQGEMTPGEADRGPSELTDGLNRATASKFASVFPVDVLQKFFEV
jgi:hypothetical protein